MRRKFSTLLVTLFFLFILSVNAFAANADLPKIHGKAAVVVDMDTGEIIYAKDIDKSPMYPASTTKLMTALLFAENKSKVDIIKYTNNAKIQDQYSLYKNLMRGKISTNDSMIAEDVMKALLIYSANDSAYMIADSVAGNPENFADMMNSKVKELGLKNTHFVTANGLDSNAPDHFTSAYDLNVILRTAFNNPWVREIMETEKAKIEVSNGTLAYITNRNKLLGKTIDEELAKSAGVNLEQETLSNAVCLGGKTGYTKKAGRCLAAIFEKDGRKLAGVILKSVYDAHDSYVFNDMVKIINWSYNAEKTKLNVEDKIKPVTVQYKPLKYFGPEKELVIPLNLKDEIKYYDNEVNKEELKIKVESLSNVDVWNLNKDSVLGNITLTQRESSNKYNLYTTITTEDIKKQNKTLYIAFGASVFGIFIVLILLVSLISKSTRKRNRRRH